MMDKRLFVIPLVFLVVVLLASAYIPETKQNPIVVGKDLLIHPLERDVWQVEHRFPWPANSLLVRMDEKDFVLVDTPQDVSGTEALLKWMDTQFGKSLRLTVINTHFHSDCLGGNSVLLKREYTVIGSDRIAPLLKERGETCRARTVDFLKRQNRPDFERIIESYQCTPYLPPNLAVNLKRPVTFYIASQPVELYFPGPGHSLDNIVVYFNRKQLLFGGCLIKALNAQRLGNVDDGDVAAWPLSVRNVIQRYPAVKTVIPGHGAPGGRSLLLHTVALVDSLS